MAEDTCLYIHAQVQPDLLPSLPALTEWTARAFSDLADTIHTQRRELRSAENLEQAR